MKFIYCLCFIMINAVLLSSCHFFGGKSDSTGTPQEQLESDLLYHIQRAETYLASAEKQAISDTLPETEPGAEYYYQRAINILDSLGNTYPSDTMITSAAARTNIAYEAYLAASSTATLDTLLAGKVLEELDSLFVHADSLDAPIDPDYEPPSHLTIPMSDHRHVQQAIKYFSNGRGRKVMQRWLERSGRYETLVKNILRQENAPPEFFYLAMIESGLNPQARSYARAVGMWQFIAATGRAYGLTQSWWYDERRDVVKASHAAGRHLLDLHEMFDDWYFAIAGYNFSPNKIKRRIRQHKVKDFWSLPRLPRQTRNYVPTFLAAVTIASDPEHYGFEVNYQEPIAFDTVTVTDCVDLNVVAKCVGSDYATLKQLNPALLRWCTPPDVDKWMLYLPRDTRSIFVDKYAEIPKEDKVSWVHHRVRSGETLSTIARRYRVSVSEIKRFNKLRGTLIRINQSLVIPVPQDKSYYRNVSSKPSSGKSSTRSATVTRKPVTNVPGHNKQVHVVRSGDSLWEIARKYNVTVSNIRKWNGLSRSRIIRPEQQLNIWLPEQTLAANQAPSNSQQTPVTTASESTESGNTIVHTVRSGDTLWDIAQSYQVSITDIKRWNNKRSNKIKPGDQLTIHNQ